MRNNYRHKQQTNFPTNTENSKNLPLIKKHLLKNSKKNPKPQFYLLWVRLWWKAAEVDPEVVVTPAVSVPKLRSSNGNWKGIVTGTRLPSIPKGVSGVDVTFWLVTDNGDAMRVKGEAFASNDAPVVDYIDRYFKNVLNLEATQSIPMYLSIICSPIHQKQ